MGEEFLSLKRRKKERNEEKIDKRLVRVGGG